MLMNQNKFNKNLYTYFDDLQSMVRDSGVKGTEKG